MTKSRHQNKLFSFKSKIFQKHKICKKTFVDVFIKKKQKKSACVKTSKSIDKNEMIKCKKIHNANRKFIFVFKNKNQFCLLFI